MSRIPPGSKKIARDVKNSEVFTDEKRDFIAAFWLVSKNGARTNIPGKPLKDVAVPMHIEKRVHFFSYAETAPPNSKIQTSISIFPVCKAMRLGYENKIIVSPITEVINPHDRKNKNVKTEIVIK